MKRPPNREKTTQSGLDPETTERRRFLRQVVGRTGHTAATAPAVAMLLGATSKMAAAGGCGCGENPVAEANGPYVYDATTTSISVDSSGSDGDTFKWTTGNGTVFNTANPGIGIQDSGLTMTTSNTTYGLDVWFDGFQEFSVNDTASVSYTNVGPTITSASGNRNPNGSVTFDSVYTDIDLGINGLIPGFEELIFEFDTTMAASAADIGDGFLDMMGTVSFTDLVSLFGSEGMHTAYANVADKAGAFNSFGFTIDVSAPPVATAPEPAVLGLIGTGLAGLGFSARRRRKQTG